MNKGRSDWYLPNYYFGNDYLLEYKKLLDEDARRDADFIKEVLRLDGIIMDLCCGWGRHSIELWKRGFEVIGVDINSTFLAHGMEVARRLDLVAGQSIQFVQADMRFLPFSQNTFSAAICCGNSLGYLEDDSENLKSLKEVYRTLRPGGQFFLEVLNRDWYLRHCPQGGRAELEGGIVSIEESKFDFSENRVISKRTYTEHNGFQRVYWTSVRLYSLNELREILERVGCFPKGVYGGYSMKEKFGPDAPLLITLAEKKK